MTIEQLIKKLSVFRIFSKKAMSTVEGLVIMIKALLVNNDEWGEKFINSDDTMLIFNDKESSQGPLLAILTYIWLIPPILLLQIIKK